MKTMYYRVQFKVANGRGWIDGYAKAGTAKAEVERVNATTQKTGVSAIYIGGKRGYPHMKLMDQPG